MTVRFEAKYNGAVSYYGGHRWAGLESTIGIGLHGTITDGYSNAKGKHIAFMVKGNALSTVMAYMAMRWPRIVRAIVAEMDIIDAEAVDGKLSQPQRSDYYFSLSESPYEGIQISKRIHTAAANAVEQMTDKGNQS